MTGYQLVGEQQFYGKLIRFFFNLAISNKRISIESMSAGVWMKQRMAELVRTNKRSKKWLCVIIYPYSFDAEQIAEISQIFTQFFI